jgi:nicotinamide-nucleotide amidase
MNAEIIAVGSELLLGQIANTNAQFLSKHLADLGINVYYHVVVGDNQKRLEQTIKQAQERSDLVLFTGGLGPTKDDLTKETIAGVLNEKLVHNNEALQRIQDYFVKAKREMTENNKKQAIILENSHVLPNDHGMAPGMALRKDGTVFILLPGPPKELQPMFLQYGIPYLQSIMEIKERIVSRVLRFFGIGESSLETELQDLIDGQTNPTIAPLAGDGEVTLRLTAKFESVEKAHEALDRVEEQIVRRVGQFLYGYDETTLAETVVQKLTKHNKTVACAESLTGGLFGDQLTQFSGASKYFKGGIVCYTNEVKRQLLQIPNVILNNQGAVSEECAKLLAENIRKQFNSDFGVSFTGVAGPARSEGKPVGTVFIGISTAEGTNVFPLNLVGNRHSIRVRSVKYGLFYLEKEFEGSDKQTDE